MSQTRTMPCGKDVHISLVASPRSGDGLLLGIQTQPALERTRTPLYSTVSGCVRTPRIRPARCSEDTAHCRPPALMSVYHFLGPVPPAPKVARRCRARAPRSGTRLLVPQLAPERTRTPLHSAVPHCVRRSRSPCVFTHDSTTPGPEHTHAQSRTHRQPMSPAVGSPPPTRACRLSSTHAT